MIYFVENGSPTHHVRQRVTAISYNIKRIGVFKTISRRSGQKYSCFRNMKENSKNWFRITWDSQVWPLFLGGKTSKHLHFYNNILWLTMCIRFVPNVLSKLSQNYSESIYAAEFCRSNPPRNANSIFCRTDMYFNTSLDQIRDLFLNESKRPADSDEDFGETPAHCCYHAQSETRSNKASSRRNSACAINH